MVYQLWKYKFSTKITFLLKWSASKVLKLKTEITIQQQYLFIKFLYYNIIYESQ